MSSTDVVHALLTALFTGAALYAVRHVIAPGRPAPREYVDHLLHAAMALAMAAMPWGPPLSRTPQTVLFAAGAVWFTLTPARRPGESRATAAARRLPSALGMAAMVWMLRNPHGTQHAAALAAPRTAALVTPVLALCLLVCALRALTRDMPSLRATPRPAAVLPLPYGHFWDGSMALGTAVMLVMPHH
ncbi:DUF5134 domain-containing protein [Streptomyces sp. NPDC050400]|uniref:DUF5134 domain-containing protein n=1 Tax=Streptomyces sp. NPDC050400 TaxID=3365610 RepID=UPI0037B0F279